MPEKKPGVLHGAEAPRRGVPAPHVGLFVSSLGDMGGAIRVAVLLANRLCQDMPVTIIELSASSTPVFPLDEQVRRVALGLDPAERLRQKLFATTGLLATCLKDCGINVVLGVGLDETVVAVRACRRLRVPLVFCDHGALINQMDDKLTTLLRAACAQLCARTVVLTNQSKQDYRRLLHVCDGKLVCIPNWISRSLLENGAAYDASSKRILWAGRLDQEKGVDLLFDIASRVLPRYPDWTWDVYGEAVLHNGGFDLVGAVRNSSLKGRLCLLGRVDDLESRYARYAVGTLTSYREGLPLFLLEGKASGLPLISFDVDTGPRDIIVEGEDGFLVQPYDCAAYADRLCQLIEDVELRRRMSAHAKMDAVAFSEEAIYLKWLALLYELASTEGEGCDDGATG